MCGTAWLAAVRRSELTDFRFHELRHAWASWHRQVGISIDEPKNLGGWTSRRIVDRYAQYATENLAGATSRIESVGLQQRDRAYVTFSPRRGLLSIT